MSGQKQCVAFVGVTVCFLVRSYLDPWCQQDQGFSHFLRSSGPVWGNKCVLAGGGHSVCAGGVELVCLVLKLCLCRLKVLRIMKRYQ